MISIVIPTYKNVQELKKNLAHNIPFFKECELIIVNDNPQDDLSSLRRQYNVLLLNNMKNLGFSGTVNRGVREAKNKYVALFNSDVLLHDNYFKKSVTEFKKFPNLFAIGFAQKEKNGAIVGKNKIYWQAGFFQHKKAVDIASGINGWAEGGACIVDRDKFLSLEGFDSIYAPFYWEDIDLSYRAWKHGFTVRFNSAVLVEHHHESTIGKYFNSRLIQETAYRNQLLFTWTNIHDDLLLLEHAAFLLYRLLLSFLKLDTVFIKGVFKALILLPTVIERRSKRQTLYTKTDREILKQFYE